MNADEYISRKAALDCFACDLRKPDRLISYQGFMTEAAFRISDIPAADVRPAVRGRWEYNPGDNIPYRSECMMPQDSECNFCHNCGADMRPTSMSGANGEES